MTKKITITLLLVLSLFALSFVQTSQKWEYKTEFHGTMSEKKLNELGTEGWELVTIGRDNQNGLQTFYFKRAKH